jgi:thiamine kinase-like enzyme
MVEEVFTPAEITELERDLVEELKRQGLPITSLRLIATKGSGSHSTVFSVLIDGQYHILKVYQEKNALERELKHLRQNVPLDRFFFVWPATNHRFRYDIVVLEVPEGEAMRSSDLTTEVAHGLAESMIRLHSITSNEAVFQDGIEERYEIIAKTALKHAEALDDFDTDALRTALEGGTTLLRAHPGLLSVPAHQVHGDPWWANIIVAAEEVYLVDWENTKFDDYAEDLAKFRVLMDYVRHEDPPTFWDHESDRALADSFMEVLLADYDTAFDDTTLRLRFAFYCLYFGAVVFGDYYLANGRSSDKVGRMMRTAIKQFQRYRPT